MIMCSGIKRRMFDCYIALFKFKIRKRVKQVCVIVLDNDACSVMINSGKMITCWILNKRIKRGMPYLPSRSDSKTNYALGGNFIYLKCQSL